MKNRALKYILLVYGIISIIIPLTIGKYYGGLPHLLSFGQGGMLFYGSLFFLGTGSIAILVATYAVLKTAFGKEQLGNPKRLLRNYSIASILVFFVVALLSHFDALHYEQLAMFYQSEMFEHSSNRNLSSSPVTYVYLPEIQGENGRYLKACVEIVKDLKAANARVAIVDFPVGLTITKEIFNYLTELKEAGIVVLSVQPSQPRFWQTGNWTVQHPTAFQFEMPWGVATAENIPPSFIQYVPYDYNVRIGDSGADIATAPDISIQAIRKYASYPESLQPTRIGNKIIVGDYTIPVFRQGFTYSRLDYWTRAVRAVYDKESSTIRYSEANFLKGTATPTMQSAPADLWRDRIVIVCPRPFGPIYMSAASGILFYEPIITRALTGNSIIPINDLNLVLILFSIILAAGICFRFPPMAASILTASVIPVVSLAGLILFDHFNVFVGTLYTILALAFCAIAMPVMKSAQKKRELEERLALEIEKKQILESQKDQLEIEVAERTKELRKEKEETERLLYNILPVEIAKELKDNGTILPRRYEEITILFTDFRGFTNTVAAMPANRLVAELNDIFKDIDDIIDKYGIEKIKTIGDSYMVAAGLPKESQNHAVQTVRAALEMVRFIEHRNETSAIKWQMRVGIHSGAAVAGVVGKRKFTYDVWGDTVNIASRMETSGEPGKINISAFTYDLIKDQFDCEYRGKVDAKGKGEIDMYFVIGEKHSS